MELLSFTSLNSDTNLLSGLNFGMKDFQCMSERKKRNIISFVVSYAFRIDGLTSIDTGSLIHVDWEGNRTWCARDIESGVGEEEKGEKTGESQR